MVDGLEWQKLSPRYGFEMPELVEQAGFIELFERNFDLSLALYSRLQQDNQENEAQYATLLGHKMRWKVTFNARQAFHMLELRSSPQGHSGYRQVAKLIHQKIAEVHPLVSSLMKYTDTNDLTELTRLEAEKTSARKLNSLV